MLPHIQPNDRRCATAQGRILIGSRLYGQTAVLHAQPGPTAAKQLHGCGGKLVLKAADEPKVFSIAAERLPACSPIGADGAMIRQKNEWFTWPPNRASDQPAAPAPDRPFKGAHWTRFS